MSLLSPERLLIGLSPGAIACVRLRGRLRSRIAGKTLIACDPAPAGQPWQGALAALQQLDLGAAAVSVVLSNHFVRYALVPWSDALRGPAEEEAYVRHHFVRVHGERAKSWAVRWSGGTGARLACAVDAELVAALRACVAKQAKARLASLQPYLMAAFNRWRGELPAAGAWLLLVEDGRACVALHAGDGWQSVQNSRGSAAELLERERHRVAGEIPDLVLACAERPLAPAPGWNLRRLPLAEARYAVALAAA